MESENPSNWYNRMSFEQLNKLSDNTVDWLNLTNKIYVNINSSIRLTSDELVIVGPTAFYKAVPKLVESTPKRVIANYFGYVFFSRYGQFTVNAFKKLNFEFNSRMSGVVKDSELWKDCLDDVQAVIPYAVSRMYLDTSFTKEDKKEV